MAGEEKPYWFLVNPSITVWVKSCHARSELQTEAGILLLLQHISCPCGWVSFNFTGQVPCCFLQPRTGYLDPSFVTIKWSFLDLQSQFCHSGIVWEPLSWRNDSYWLWWKESTHFSFCHLLVKCESLIGIQSSKSYQIRFLWKSCLAGWALSESKMEQKGRFVMLDFHLCKKKCCE